MKDENFFDPDLAPAPALAPSPDISDTDPDHLVTPSAEKKPLEFYGWSWKAWLGFIAAFGVFTGWMLWPDTPSATSADAPLVDTRSQTVPQSAGATPDIHPVTDETATLHHEMTELMSAQQHYSLDNREAIAALSRRLDSTERRLATLDAQVSTRVTPPKQVTKPSVQTVSQTAVRKHTRRRTTPRLTTTGWQVNTIYSGMAWITHGDSTWAVHPGDSVQGLQISGIDVARRQVITDHGIIR